MEGDGLRPPIRNMKHCRGLTELFKNSFVIPSWGGFAFDLSDSEQKQSSWKANFKLAGMGGSPSDTAPQVGNHGKAQYGDLVPDDYVHYKISSPWYLKCNRETQFMLSDPYWNKKDPNAFNVLPGLLDFKYQDSTNINVMLQYTHQPRKVQIEVGDVLAMITPLTEDDVILNHHLVEEKYFEAYSQLYYRINPKNLTHYLTMKKIMQEQEERNRSKCPFGFGK